MDTVAPGLCRERDIAQLTRELKNRVTQDGNKSHVTVEEQLTLIDELAEFELGRFVIANGAIDGRWTRYICLHPTTGRISGRNSEGREFSKLETWFLDRAPGCVATQERFSQFKNITQDFLRPGIRLASIPCGWMEDLLSLNFSEAGGVSLVGIDLDDRSLEAAQKIAIQYGLEKNSQFRQADAWNLEIREEFDLISSNGLNIYEPNDSRVAVLYQKFYEALKPGGLLVFSFLTPGPGLAGGSGWNLVGLDPNDLRLQRIVFSDILHTKWQAYRSSDLTIHQLQGVGFKDIQLIYDHRRMFPTGVARK